jgi:hypothetical protein
MRTQAGVGRRKRKKGNRRFVWRDKGDGLGNGKCTIIIHFKTAS